MAQTSVVETIDVAAPLNVVWLAISNPQNYGRWSPENVSAVRLSSSSGEWSVGEKFKGRNRLWVSWTTSCTVTIADAPATFAFDVTHMSFPIAEWRYELTQLGTGGTRVTESWTDHRVGAAGIVTKRLGLLVGRGADAATRNRETMRSTLQALKTELEANG